MRSPIIVRKWFMATLIFLILLLMTLIFMAVFPGFQDRYESVSGKSPNSIPTFVRNKDNRSNRYLLRHPTETVTEEEMKQLADYGPLENSPDVPQGLYVRRTGIIYVLRDVMPDLEQGWVDTDPDGCGRCHATSRNDYLGTIRQRNGIQVLRHEYGHALLEDYLFHGVSENRKNIFADFWSQNILGKNILAKTQNGNPNRDWMFPESIRELLSYYRRQLPDIYGDVYYTTNFHEFFAESYARYLAGESIPEEFEKFFGSLF